MKTKQVKISIWKYILSIFQGHVKAKQTIHDDNLSLNDIFKSFLVISILVDFLEATISFNLHSFIFLISKKRILLIKEKQEKHKEFTVMNKGTKRQRQPLIYSNRRKKIQKGQNNPRNPNTETNQRGSTGTTLITESQFSPHP